MQLMSIVVVGCQTVRVVSGRKKNSQPQNKVGDVWFQWRCIDAGMTLDKEPDVMTSYGRNGWLLACGVALVLALAGPAHAQTVANTPQERAAMESARF